MRCPKCQSAKSSVVDSRPAEGNVTIRRRRECESCQYRFTTYERLEEKTLVVVKKDGTREPFSREKIFNGVVSSAQKRPIATSKIEEVVTKVEQQVKLTGDAEVDSVAIGNLVMTELIDLDEITYIRFASVYRSFKDIAEIEMLLQQLTGNQKEKK